MSTLSPEAVIWVLRLYNVTTNVIEFLYSHTSRLYLNVYEAFSTKTYSLFADIPFLYSNISYNTNSSSPLSAKPLWTYSPVELKFTEWSSQPTTTKKIQSVPLLSIELVENDTTVYDITEFVNNIRVETSEDKNISPSICHIVQAWMLHIGIVLDPSRQFKVRIIDLSAETVEFDINNMTLLITESAACVAEEIAKGMHDANDLTKVD